MSSLGERICLAYEFAGLDKQELADKIKIKKQAVWTWETNRRKPSEINLQKISTICRVSRQWLETGEGPMTKSATEKNKPDLVQNNMNRYADKEVSPPQMVKDAERMIREKSPFETAELERAYHAVIREWKKEDPKNFPFNVRDIFVKLDRMIQAKISFLEETDND